MKCYLIFTILIDNTSSYLRLPFRKCSNSYIQWHSLKYTIKNSNTQLTTSTETSFFKFPPHKYVNHACQCQIDRSWGTDRNCPSHHTAEVSQEQAGWWTGLYPSVSENYRDSAAYGIRSRATSSYPTRVWKWGWNVNWYVKRMILISKYCNRKRI